jgi:hypothetical protein
VVRFATVSNSSDHLSRVSIFPLSLAEKFPFRTPFHQTAMI